MLLRAASKLQAVSEDLAAGEPALLEAVRYNRKLWTLFAGAVGREDNPLPAELRSNIMSLANFVFNKSIGLEVRPEPKQLGVLVSINRELAAGLSAQP